MNWIDFFILFVLFLGLLSGYKRGVFKEISTLIGLTLGVVFSVSNADWLTTQLGGRINMSPSVLYVFSFIIVFSAGMLVLKILGHYFYRMVKITPMTVPNKIFGGIFGMAKGVLALSLLFLLFVFPTPFKKLDSAIGESAMAKPVRGFAPLIYDNTAFFHPKSKSFLAEIQNGILLSNAEFYAENPRSALKDKTLLGMTEEDVETLDKLSEYFGKSEK